MRQRAHHPQNPYAMQLGPPDSPSFHPGSSEIDGLPTYQPGTAPDDLVTQNQLDERRLKRVAGQCPVGWL